MEGNTIVGDNYDLEPGSPTFKGKTAEEVMKEEVETEHIYGFKVSEIRLLFKNIINRAEKTKKNNVVLSDTDLAVLKFLSYLYDWEGKKTITHFKKEESEVG